MRPQRGEEEAAGRVETVKMFRYNGHEAVKGTAQSQGWRSEGGHAEEEDGIEDGGR